MKHPFVATCLAGVALAVSTFTTASADSGSPSPAVEILVDGQARPLYAHEGRWYLEALKGQEYAIRIRNPFGVRVAVALSVDGLNTIDARETTAQAARKWVLQPYQTITLEGWQTSSTTARRFEFTTEARSYGAALGKTENLGIISAVFFKERHQPTAILKEQAGAARSRPAPEAPAERRQDAAKSADRQEADSELAATGMGRETDHAVTQVRLDLEDRPAHAVALRYEFRPQLVQLGVLPARPVTDALSRRERARGFEQGFAPVPPAFRR
ncbi:MAG: hypothetical protein HOP16_17350 [Acidobacteria bacterium]|nr:hypothetical protein [Acidobacteriota bacterium]